MPYPHYPAEEVAARGEAIYEQQIRAKIGAQHKGKFVVIDIETGEYEIDDDDLAATKRALAKRPERDHFELSYATRLNRGVGLYCGLRP